MLRRAGVPSVYNQTCANTGTTGQCVRNSLHSLPLPSLMPLPLALPSTTHSQTADNVFGAGSPRYNDAYFELNYVRGYTLDGVSISTSAAVNYSSPSAVLSSVIPASATSSGKTPTTTTSASVEWRMRAPGIIWCTALLAVVGFYVT
jgi:hypothetical protein